MNTARSPCSSRFHRLGKKPKPVPIVAAETISVAYRHVNPAGGVRSCLLAPGSSSFGTLGPERLPQLLNRAAEQPVTKLFAEGDIERFVTEHIAPFRGLYRQITHPCAASALVARVAAERAAHVESQGRGLTAGEELALHRELARSWNLEAARAPEVRVPRADGGKGMCDE